MKRIKVSDEIIQEARNILDGVYYPLKGFLNREDLKSVLDTMRLTDGQVWPMPVVLDMDERTAEDIKSEKKVLISNGNENIILDGISVYRFNKKDFARKLFGTDDKNHPGVAGVYEMNDYLVGGEAKLYDAKVSKIHEHYLTPQEVKEIFRKNNWNRVVAFQTRNAPHRSHEHLQKEALRMVDGLFINPVIGPKKKGDFKDDHIIGSYKILINRYHPKDKVLLGTLHTFMRYAGPKEALFHALVRRNFGCTHMIVGRDHAGVGNYYGPYDAQEIFDDFSPEELGIEVIKFDNASYCVTCRSMVVGNKCGHDESVREQISGTDLRNKLLKGEAVSDKIIRKEIIEYLLKNREDLFM